MVSLGTRSRRLLVDLIEARLGIMYLYRCSKSLPISSRPNGRKVRLCSGPSSLVVQVHTVGTMLSPSSCPGHVMRVDGELNEKAFT